LKALLIRLSSAGDILLMSGVVQLLNNSGIETHVLVKPAFTRIAAELGAGRVHAYAGTETVKKLRSEQFDIVCDLHGTLRSMLISFRLRAARKITIKKHGLRRRLLVLFKWFRGKGTSVYGRYIQTVAQAAGIKPASLRIKKAKHKAGKKVLMHAGARWPLKRWPHMETLAQMLAKKGYSVTVTGVKDEVEKQSSLLYIKGKGISNLIGKTDIGGLLDRIKKCDIFIGNDTMAAHAAAFYGKQSFVFMGPTVSEFGFIDRENFTVLEKELACRPCGLHGKGKCATGGFECMKGISPEMAFSAVVKKSIRKLNDQTL